MTQGYRTSENGLVLERQCNTTNGNVTSRLTPNVIHVTVNNMSFTFVDPKNDKYSRFYNKEYSEKLTKTSIIVVTDPLVCKIDHQTIELR